MLIADVIVVIILIYWFEFCSVKHLTIYRLSGEIQKVGTGRIENLTIIYKRSSIPAELQETCS